MTLATTISYVRRNLEDNPYQDVTTGYTAAASTIAMNASTQWKTGEWMEDQTAGGQLLVTADGSGGTVSVKGGYHGTTDATIATGVVMLKQPRFAYNQISNAISEVIGSLFPQVWVEAVTTITPSTSADIYNLPTDYEGLIDIMHATTGTTEVKRPGFVQEMRAPTGTLASGAGLRIRGWHRTDTTATLIYKTQATTSNMPDALERIVARGVAALLLEGEAARYANDGSEKGQGIVRNALTAQRFNQDTFERECRRYHALLSRDVHTKRYLRPLVIGG